VFIGHQKQSELCTSAIWSVVTEFTYHNNQQQQRQQNQFDLLDTMIGEETQMLISDELLPNLLAHFKTVEEGGASLQYLQPTVLRFVCRTGHFIISRFRNLA